MRFGNVSGFRLRRGFRFGCILFGLFTAILARADTVKLKDGTVLEGQIVSEDDTQLVIEVTWNALGTIRAKQAVSKSDVAEVTRLTEEQKAFQQVQEYQLDPNTSEPQSYYDHVIKDVFRRFLSQFPNSPHAEEVNEKTAEWVAERDKVANGLARVGSEWIPKAEAEKRADLVRTRSLLDEGRSLMVQSNYSQALERFKAVISTSKQPDPVDEAKRLYADACHLWFELLERQRPPLADEVKSYEDRVVRTSQKRAEARGKLGAASRVTSEASAKMRADYEHASAEYMDASNHLTGLQLRLSGLEQAITQAQAYAAVYNVNLLQPGSSMAPPAGTTTAEPATNQPPSPPEPSTPQPTLSEGIGDFVQRYWVYGVVVLVGGLWVISRLTTRRR